MADPFVSRADLTDYLGRTVTTDDGALIAVDAACDMVRNYAEQTFNEVTDDEIVLDGTGTDALLLPELPISEVSEVLIDATTVTDYVLNGTGVLLRKSAGFVSNVWDQSIPPSIWPIGRQNITVTYTHGYAADDLPRDVRICALTIASRLIVQGVAQFETVGGDSMRYAVASTDLTNGEKLLLRKYRQAQ